MTKRRLTNLTATSDQKGFEDADPKEPLVTSTSQITPVPIHDGSYESLASTIYSSHIFKQAFAQDGSTFGDRVEEVIMSVVEGSTLRTGKDFACTRVRAYLRRFVGAADRDSILYDNSTDIELAKIHNVYLASEGNILID